MKATVNTRTTDLNRAVKLEMSVDEAVALEAILGGMRGTLARTLPWYGGIADALEGAGLVTTISHAIEQRFHRFEVGLVEYPDGDKLHPGAEIEKRSMPERARALHQS